MKAPKLTKAMREYQHPKLVRCNIVKLCTRSFMVLMLNKQSTRHPPTAGRAALKDGAK